MPVHCAGIESLPVPAGPTENDKRNAEIRRAIAERQEQEWNTCYLKALAAFGPGWIPSCRHFLIDKDEEDRCRRTGARPRAAATVYTVKDERGERRHFTLAGDTVTEHASYQEAFGAMLLEPHPTQTIEVRGETVHPHRYSLCWAPIERYHPLTAEQLAALRESRQRKKAEREEQKFRAQNPLLAGLE